MDAGCPSDQVIADFVMRRLAGREAARVERHIDRCPACRELVSTLARGSTVGPAVEDETAEVGADAQIGRFVVIEPLGRGGMGVVYAAHDPTLDRRVALKLLHGDAGGAERGARLLREAQALARLAHPNVVAVYDIGQWSGQVFVAMELVDGATLWQWQRERPRPWREVLAMYCQAGHGLAAAHAAGFVHRDFKPDNVLIGRDGRARVTDFGLARLSDAPADPPPPDALADEITITGALVGTPAFMAPEQLDGRGADARADQFAFCVALYEALSGQWPFPGATVAELRAAMAAGPLRELRADVPAWLRRALARGLALDPAQRHESMSCLLDALTRGGSSRRRFAIVSGLLAAAATAAWLLGSWDARSAAVAPCIGGEARLDGVWDAKQKRAVRAAFTATGKPFADDAWRGAQRAIDDYTAAWLAMHQEACEATAVRKEQSEELLDLRMHCLGRRLAEVEALTAMLSRADPSLVERAVELASALSPLSHCADTIALRDPAPMPTEPAARAEVSALLQTFARVTVVRNANNLDEARRLLDDALRRARKVGHVPAEAEAIYLSGSVERNAGNAVKAEEQLKQALLVAEASRADRVKASVLIELAEVSGALGRTGDGFDYARQAQATISRMGGDDSLSGRVEMDLGLLFYMDGKYEEALVHYGASLDQARREHGAIHPDVAAVLNNIGNTEFLLRRPEDAARHFREALAINEQVRGPLHPVLVGELSNLASCLRELGKLDEAEKLLQRALAVAERSLGPDHPDLVAVLSGLGHQALDRDNARALRYFERARALLSLPGRDPSQLAAITSNIADAHLQLGHHDEAIRLYEQSAQLWTAARGSAHPELAVSHDGIAAVLTKQGKHAGAAARFEQALALREAALGPDHPDVAWTRFELAKSLWQARAPERARTLARSARTIWATAGADAEARSVEQWLANHR